MTYVTRSPPLVREGAGLCFLAVFRGSMSSSRRMTLDDLAKVIDDALKTVAEFSAEEGSPRVEAALKALKAVGDDKNRKASTDALRVFKERMIGFGGGVTAATGALQAIRTEIAGEPFIARAAQEPDLIAATAREVADIAAKPQLLLDEAVARAEFEFAKLSHDLILFISFDMLDHHLDGFRQRAHRERKIQRAATSGGVVREFSMSGSKTLRYLEATLTPEHFDGATPPDLLDAFGRLTEQSKVVFLGHGSAESEGVETEGAAKDDEPRAVLFRETFKRFGSEIHQRTKGRFASPTGPQLDVTLYSCQGAATLSYERSSGERLTVKSGVLQRANGTVVDARITMAGQLMEALRSGGVHARVKAKATTIISPTRFDVQIDDDAAGKTINVFASKQERRGAGLVRKGRDGRDYVPADLAVAAAWRRKDDNGPSVNTFRQVNPNAKAYENAPHVTEHDFVAKAVFQGSVQRRHGYKRVFTWRADGTLRCIDIADGTDVDFIFETNKDRAIWFIIGTARHLAADAVWKYDGMMTLCEKLDGAKNAAELATRMREIAEHPTVNAHTSKLSRMLGRSTRSSLVLTEVANILAKVPAELLPMPVWEDRKLGVV